MPLDALYLDIDGTLCRYGLEPQVALPRVAREHGVARDLDPDEYYLLYREVERERPGRPYREVSDEAYGRLLARSGYDDADLARRVGAAYRALRLGSLDLYPEALEVLDALHGEVPLGVISNGPADIQWEKLERFGLRRFFDAVVISGEVGVEKPDPSIFRLALERLGVEAPRSAHVGDNLEADVRGALQAGLTAAWVNREDAPAWIPKEVAVRPHLEVRDLRGILPLALGKPTPP